VPKRSGTWKPPYVGDQAMWWAEAPGTKRFRQKFTNITDWREMPPASRSRHGMDNSANQPSSRLTTADWALGFQVGSWLSSSYSELLVFRMRWAYGVRPGAAMKNSIPSSTQTMGVSWPVCSATMLFMAGSGHLKAT